jgi:hypothetical protein
MRGRSILSLPQCGVDESRAKALGGNKLPRAAWGTLSLVALAVEPASRRYTTIQAASASSRHLTSYLLPLPIPSQIQISSVLCEHQYSQPTQFRVSESQAP